MHASVLQETDSDFTNTLPGIIKKEQNNRKLENRKMLNLGLVVAIK
jgi:hypothetical protein